MSTSRVLIVDSDNEVRRELVECLLSDGHQTRGAADEGEALRAILAWRPDLLVIDPRLPDGAGLRLASALRRARRRFPLPVILLGSLEFGERRPDLNLGAGVYFHAKPVDPARLSSQAFRALKRQRDSAVYRGLRGDLALMGLSVLLSHLESERSSGTLRLHLDDLPGRARLDWRDGHLLRARIEGRPEPRDAELLYALLPITTGYFEFLPGQTHGPDEIRTPVTALLLEGARRFDEAPALVTVPSGSNPDRPFQTGSGSPGGSND